MKNPNTHFMKAFHKMCAVCIWFLDSFPDIQNDCNQWLYFNLTIKLKAVFFWIGIIFDDAEGIVIEIYMQWSHRNIH